MTPASSGSYRLEIKKSAVKAISALPMADRRRVDATIISLAGNPRPAGCKPLIAVPDTYRVRAGNFRIIYQVLDRVLLVLVVRVGNRRDVYRGL